MATAFVAGATGYTGKNVVAMLAGDGHRVVAHVRPGSSQLEAARTEFERVGAEVDTTPWDEAAMADTLRRLQPQVIFGLLGTTARRARQEKVGGDPYEKVDYGLTALLIRAAVAAGRHPRFVYLSAVGVSEREPRGAYMRARWKVERDLKASPLPWVVVRPAIIGGDREQARPGEHVGRVLGDAVLGVLGAVGLSEVKQRYRSRTGAELARSIVTLALDPAAANRAFDGAELP